MRVHWILAIYRTLLALFPVRYQDEFGEELLYAVRMSVEQAQARGRLFVIRLAWRELRDLPGACLRAHLNERRGMMMKLQPGAHLPDGPFKFWQLAAVFLPFSIAMLGVALDLSPGRNFTSLLCGMGGGAFHFFGEFCVSEKSKPPRAAATGHCRIRSATRSCFGHLRDSNAFRHASNGPQ
jgi:hypothetical protein